MRKLFISDIHGHFHPMIELLKTVDYNPAKDQLVVGGDMVNRGPDSGLVIKQLKSLDQRYEHVYVLQGNHEDMIHMKIRNESDMFLDHGGVETLYSLKKTFPDQDELEEHLKWLITRPYMLEDTDHIYVHAGLNPERELHDNEFKDEMIWMPYHEENGKRFSDYDKEEILKRTSGKKVVHGHTPRQYIFDDGARICCDLGAGVWGDNAKLALVDLTNDCYYQYAFDTGKITKRKIARKKVAP